MKKIMNIVFVNSNKIFGGGEIWMIKAAKGLIEAGHKVFLAGVKDSKVLNGAKQSGIQTVVFNIHSDFNPVSILSIARFLKKEKIQVLICNVNKDVRVAGIAGRLVKTSAVIARHGVLLCGKKWRHKFILSHIVDGILTNTETIKQTYLNYGWFNQNFIKVIYNGVEDKLDVQPYNFSQEFPDKKIIFGAGRLTEQKGFEYLIKSAALLQKSRKDLVFIIAGEGKLEPKLRHLIKKLHIEDSFYLWGFKDNINPYLKGCDLFVLSSIQEGMPGVVMEAMAVGKAVIATDVNGVRELMEHKKTGLIIPTRNPEILAKSINQLIDNDTLLKEYGINGLKRVKENFTISIMIKNLEDYFIEKIEEKTK